MHIGGRPCPRRVKFFRLTFVGSYTWLTFNPGTARKNTNHSTRRPPGISSVLVVCCLAGISKATQSQRADGEWSVVVSSPVVRRRELTSLCLTVGACVCQEDRQHTVRRFWRYPRDRRRSRLKSHWTWISISCMTYCVRIYVSIRFLSGSAHGLCRLERLQSKHLSYFWEGWADTRNMGVTQNENWSRGGKIATGRNIWPSLVWMTCIESPALGDTVQLYPRRDVIFAVRVQTEKWERLRTSPVRLR
ncbi:hypothetical protein EDB92DRAFT_171651 [Lactarius akahatsu]|uniref:Uncharacterized protein n=1 Tax=Lactarius akahatsu TaxID=416441 RepID=A0AAD4LCN5_9AGAM|nr:hypothetical protein EDB92DRAFT_171651 [Lactarius akahatsu]